MLLTTQYYRPPFPETRRWREDLREIRATGFSAIYVTMPWSWLEPAPGEFDFHDFDELFEQAAAVGLRVIPNIWVESQPLWIHRALPDAHMVDHTGRTVASSHLVYLNGGLTPGGCTDHPELRERCGRFISTAVSRYAGAQNLLLWDCWNEIRWMLQSDGHVCYCPHTVTAYRHWLEGEAGGLEGLNEAWHRRYRSWEDVHPANGPNRNATDALAFQAFLTARAAVDLKWRRDTVYAADSGHPIIAHGISPSVYATGAMRDWEPALARGDDWELASLVDGWGASHYPRWTDPSASDYGARVESARSAAGDSEYWLSELQGGAAGLGLRAMDPVPGDLQARWIWSGIGRGAKGINLWAWRDEVFGRESGGYGITGDDGFREQRLAELIRTAEVLRSENQLLDDYQPMPARVGVLFEPAAYHLDWASLLEDARLPSGLSAGESLQGYLRALERLQIPYDVVGRNGKSDLAQYALLVMPWPLIVDCGVAERCAKWIQAGGTLLAEAGIDSFDRWGFYRYPEERTFATELGLSSRGRRLLGTGGIPYDVGGQRGELRTAGWLEPLDSAGALFSRHRLGGGTVCMVGSFVGQAYLQKRYRDFERFVMGLASEAGGLPGLRCSQSDGELVQWRFGHSSGTPLLFVLNEGGWDETVFTGRELADLVEAEDLLTGAKVSVTSASIAVALRPGGSHVFRFR